MTAIGYVAMFAIAGLIGFAIGFVRGAFWCDDWALNELIEYKLKQAEKEAQ